MQQDWQQLIDQTVQDESLRNAYEWEPFAKGSSNSIFLGRLKDDIESNKQAESTVILRINAPAKDTPGVKRYREEAILNWINTYDWAPQIIQNEPEQGWCLMHYYDSLKTKGDKLSNAHQAQLIRALNELHAIPMDSANPSNDALTMDYEVFLNETYLPLATRSNDANGLAGIQSIKGDLSTLPDLPACLVHHDIHLGNLVLAKPSAHTREPTPDLIILDWEYAAIGNPWFDASCLSRYLSIPDPDIFSLSIFKTLDEETFKSALKQANHMTEALQELWYWAREE